MTAALALVWLLGAAAGAVELSGEAGAGGGFETNVDHALESEPTRGAGFAEAWASAGAHQPFGDANELYLQLAYDGTVIPDAQEYSIHRFSLAAGALVFAGDRVLLRLSPAVGYRLSPDSGRDGFDYALSLAARVRLVSWLSVRVNGMAQRRDARDAIWAYDLVRGRAGAELDLGKVGLWSAGASLEGVAAQTASLPVGSVFAPDELGPGVTSAWVADLGARWRLGDHLQLEVGGFITRASTTDGAWTSHVIRGGLGASF